MEQPHRNESCPCGSGRKYKKCCALKAQPATPALDGLTPREAVKLPTDSPETRFDVGMLRKELGLMEG
jgi:hypothetical protein